MLIRNLLQDTVGYKNKENVKLHKLSGLSSCNTIVKMSHITITLNPRPVRFLKKFKEHKHLL